MPRAPFSAALVSPAAARNREPILDVLRANLPHTGMVLEIAAGSGEHALRFASACPGLLWQPTDLDDLCLASISAWRDAAGSANLLPPLRLDAADPLGWPLERADAVVAINMIHIAPWAATQGLMKGASRLLGEGGVMVLYGPYLEPGSEPVPGNVAFDRSLRGRNPAWGVRHLDAVVALAAQHDLALTKRVAMPANNLALVFRRIGCTLSAERVSGIGRTIGSEPMP